MNAKLSKNKAKRPHRHKVKFPGVREDARQLGVSAPHLWLVLNGQRTSHDLKSRYQTLKAKQEVAS